MKNMDKYRLIEALTQETKNLQILVNSLSDESKLCFPKEYDCSRSIDEIIYHLKVVKVKIRRMKENNS